MKACTATPLDLGGGIISAELRCIDGEPQGVSYVHPGAGGDPCEGYAPIGDPNWWHLDSREPLTLSPSLHCRRCGHHGFIREGKWVPA